MWVLVLIVSVMNYSTRPVVVQQEFTSEANCRMVHEYIVKDLTNKRLSGESAIIGGCFQK